MDTCQKFTGVILTDLCHLCQVIALQKAHVVALDSQHLWNREFNLLPLGRRFYFPWGDTNRPVRSFIASAIVFLNKMWFCVWHWCSPELLLSLLILITSNNDNSGLALTYMYLCLWCCTVLFHLFGNFYCYQLFCYCHWGHCSQVTH